MCFYNSVIKASVVKLTALLGAPRYDSNNGKDKVNFEWECKNEHGIFSIYDWKEYRSISKDEEIEWHIGGDSELLTNRMKTLLFQKTVAKN